MKIANNITVYLKTTDTCNLNCSHCFTSGSQGKKIYFSPEKTISFFQRLRKERPNIQSVRFLFHGGEPLIAPIESLREAYKGLKDIFPQTTFGLQTNLVFPLTNEKRQFIKDVLYDYGFGTSWDYDIRFGSNASDPSKKEELKLKQKKLWEENVKTLVSDGHYMTMIVCLTKNLIKNMEPIELINYAHELGFKHLLVERITSDGHAKLNSPIIPTNREQDLWLKKMFDQTIQYKTYEYIGNMFLSEVAEGFLNHKHVGNRCRECEQSLLTINASGSIAGCPNTATEKPWGHIDWEISENLNSPQRLDVIRCEKLERNPLCYKCNAFPYCNSDCHQLAWDENGTHCAAPISIWQEMIKNKDIETYKKLTLD